MDDRSMNSTDKTYTIRVENYHNDDTFDVCHETLAVAQDIACRYVRASVDADLWFAESENNFAFCTVYTPDGRPLECFAIHSHVDFETNEVSIAVQ